MSLKKTLIFVLGLVCICGLALLVLNRTQSFKAPSKDKAKKEIHLEKKQDQPQKSHPSSLNGANQTSSPSPGLVSKDFKKEALIIKNLSENYPQSKRDLMALLTQDQEINPAPVHSAEEIAQNKKGALKVLALKVLVEKEKDKDQLYKDLNEISERSSDAALVKIVEEVLKADQQGRNFFDDFSEAISSMPL